MMMRMGKVASCAGWAEPGRQHAHGRARSKHLVGRGRRVQQSESSEVVQRRSLAKKWSSWVGGRVGTQLTSCLANWSRLGWEGFWLRGVRQFKNWGIYLISGQDDVSDWLLSEVYVLSDHTIPYHTIADIYNQLCLISYVSMLSQNYDVDMQLCGLLFHLQV